MSLRILICDDTQFMRNIISTMFCDEGHVIVGEAETSEQAINMYRELRPDIVTMDVVMPGDSGINAVRKILSGDPKARVIMCSALGQEALIEEAMDAGASGFLVKPFNSEKMMDLVADLLGAKSGSQAE